MLLDYTVYSRKGQKFEATPIEKEIGYYPQWSMGQKEVINMTRRQHGLPPVSGLNILRGLEVGGYQKKKAKPGGLPIRVMKDRRNALVFK